MGFDLENVASNTFSKKGKTWCSFINDEFATDEFATQSCDDVLRANETMRKSTGSVIMITHPRIIYRCDTLGVLGC